MNVPLHIEEFIKKSGQFPVIDVRSPAEFEHGHIPGAYNIPLFNNEERACVGTAYKQIGRQKAVETGYEIVNPKRPFFINSIFQILQQETENRKQKTENRKPETGNRKQKTGNNKPVTSNLKPETILVHCWRGGMRSAGFANFLNENGFSTHTLVRGYKAYRNHVLKSFEADANLLIIGGETGSGKTEILRNISRCGEQIIDLEALAHHKGSAFGALGEKPQPTQEQFENNLSDALSRVDFSKRVWIEDESHSIGRCYIPNPLWEKMKKAPILRMSIPKQERISRLVNDYGNFSKEDLARCIRNIERRLGPQHAKNALEELEKGNLPEVTDITLTYYDKAYNYDHEKRNMKDVFFLECSNADAIINAGKAIAFANRQLNPAHA